MAEIQLRNIGKRWGSFIGVDNFDLTIADKEFLVLLGPSGCGKTTTMRMIAGLEDATEGEIVIDGKVVNDLEPKERDVAMVFQSYALYPNKNVYENIRFPLKVRKIDPATHDERIRRASAMVELDDFLHRRPAELSGGQRQRVALARAIVLRPKVVLYDEPTTGLDPIRADVINELILKLQRELAITSIVVTHDMTSAFKVADHLVMLHGGRVVMEGTAQQFRDSTEPHVRRFLQGEATPEELAEIREQYERELMNPKEALSLGSVSSIVMPGTSRRVLAQTLAFLMRTYEPRTFGCFCLAFLST